MTQEQQPLSDELVSPFLNLLQALRVICGGDLDKNIILLAVAERTIAHPDFKSLTDSERVSEGDRPFPTLGVNARSIAESTGMPRETVRRKVGALVRAGWIARSEQGLQFTSEGYRALTPAREGLTALAVRFHELLAARESPRAG